MIIQNSLTGEEIYEYIYDIWMRCFLPFYELKMRNKKKSPKPRLPIGQADWDAQPKETPCQRPVSRSWCLWRWCLASLSLLLHGVLVGPWECHHWQHLVFLYSDITVTKNWNHGWEWFGRGIITKCHWPGWPVKYWINIVIDLSCTWALHLLGQDSVLILIQVWWEDDALLVSFGQYFFKRYLDVILESRGLAAWGMVPQVRKRRSSMAFPVGDFFNLQPLWCLAEMT